MGQKLIKFWIFTNFYLSQILASWRVPYILVFVNDREKIQHVTGTRSNRYF